MTSQGSAESATARAGGTIDASEVARFERIARTWWDPDGAMKTLHKFNPVRLAFIRDRICEALDRDPRSASPLAGLSLLDVGCGGGLVCEPLAKLGADVTGIDPAPTNIEVARLHAQKSGSSAVYRQATVEELVAEGKRYDVVLAMEVVEHVADVDLFVRSCCQAVAPGGFLFMATLNRTKRAFALAIIGAEYVLGWLPRGTHQWEKFVTPDELAAAIAAGGLAVEEETGVVYNPFTGRWSASQDTAVNYMVLAR